MLAIGIEFWKTFISKKLNGFFSSNECRDHLQRCMQPAPTNLHYLKPTFQYCPTLCHVQFPHSPSDPVEEEDDLLALGRDVPRQLDDPLLLVVLQIQGAAIEEKQRMKEGRDE